LPAKIQDDKPVSSRPIENAAFRRDPGG